MSPTVSYNMPDYIHNDLFCNPIGWFYPMSHDIPSTSMPLYPPIWCLKTYCSGYGLQTIMKSWNSYNISVKSHQLFHNSSQFHRCFTSIPFQLLSQSQALPLRQVHKHSGMGCAVVSLSTAETREAIMCYAEKTFGRSAAGKLEMDIADVKVQLSLGTVGKGTLW